MGDRVLVAPYGMNTEIPLTDRLALSKNWTSGGCISGMGRHWGYDYLSRPHLSGHAATLMPVIPMYHDGFISAVLIFTQHPQEIYPLGQWEGPFIPWLFCKNFCSEDCMKHESSLSLFTTLHFLFHDAALNTCEDRCPSSSLKKR